MDFFSLAKLNEGGRSAWKTVASGVYAYTYINEETLDFSRASWCGKQDLNLQVRSYT